MCARLRVFVAFLWVIWYGFLRRFGNNLFTLNLLCLAIGCVLAVNLIWIADHWRVAVGAWHELCRMFGGLSR